jgi:type II protein arginine methyltransferase
MTQKLKAIVGARTILEEAMKLHEAGDLTAAEARYKTVIEAGYRVADVLPIMAGLLGLRGAYDEALATWDMLLAISPAHDIAHHEKSLIYSHLGQADLAIAALQASCAANPDNPVSANNLAVLLADAGRKHEALEQFHRALELQPGNIHIEHQVRRLNAEMVPFWHIPMLNDTRRNDAFEAAILAAVKDAGPRAKVLDIGTGTGLLSMMAARAGAQSVTACEMVPVIADMARAIIADNGYGDRVTVHTIASTELKIGEHLPERADILVSEILSSDLLTEKVIETFEDAHARLLAPDAIIIPRAASAIGCLVESQVLADYVFVDQVSGFDVSRFGALAAQKLPIHGTMTDWKRLSHDVELLRIDLACKAHAAEIQVLNIAVIEDGIAAGIVQWMQVDLAEGITFDNHPDGYFDGGWLQVLHTFPHPIPVKAGDILNVAVGHDRVTLIVRPLDLVKAASHAMVA